MKKLHGNLDEHLLLSPQFDLRTLAFIRITDGLKLAAGAAPEVDGSRWIGQERRPAP